MTSLETDFAAFVDRRDPDALARVFDATAGRLLLLSAHLGSRRANAEDLVQATFLAAMRRGATWDRRRPLWPWLATILHNEARMQWRQRQQRREVGIDDAADAAGRERDPSRLAASDEALETVARAIDVMPLDDRQILRLRLVHGLQPIEIARALEVPVGTVRVRLHRARERLRAVVPASLGAALAALLSGDELLAQVKANVMAEATVATASAVAASLGWGSIGGLAMKAKTLVLTGLAAVALLAIAVAVGWPPGSDDGRNSDDANAPLAVGAVNDGASPAPAPVESLQRSPVVADPDPLWPLVVTVRTPDGQPVIGAAVEVEVAPRGSEELPGREFLAGGETGADGTFHCRLDTQRERSVLFRSMNFVRVTASTEAMEPRNDLISLPRGSEVQAFEVEIQLRPAVVLSGRVVDHRGAGVPGAEILEVWPFGESGRRERSGAEGAFRLFVQLGDRLLEAAAASAADPDSRRPKLLITDSRHGNAMVALPVLEQHPDPGAVVDLGTIVLQQGGTVRGRVELGDGSPLAGFPIDMLVVDEAFVAGSREFDAEYYIPKSQRRNFSAGLGAMTVQRAQGRTQPDGSFVFAGLEPGATCAVAVRDTAMQWICARAQADGHEVRLVVDRQLVLLDVGGEQGESLPGANIVAEGFSPDATGPADHERPGFPSTMPYVVQRSYPSDSEGRRMLLSSFGWVWRLGSWDEIVQPNFVRHDAMAGIYRAAAAVALRAEARFGAVRLEVVDERGDPLDPFEARLRCDARGVERQASSRQLLVDPVLAALPVGQWRIMVGAGKKPQPFWEIFQRGTHVQDVTITEGAVTEVRYVIPPAGLVAFRVHSEQEPENGAWPGLKIHAEPDGSAVPVYALDAAVNRRHLAVANSRLVTREPFPPGPRRFVLEVRGFHPARCEVDVQADQLVVADVTLFPR